MLPELVVGIVSVLTGSFALLTYFWGANDTKKKLLSEKYHFGEKKYNEGFADALLSVELSEQDKFALVESTLPAPKKPKVVKKFKKGKK